jgi:hypothetical protein
MMLGILKPEATTIAQTGSFLQIESNRSPGGFKMRLANNNLIKALMLLNMLSGMSGAGGRLRATKV